MTNSKSEIMTNSKSAFEDWLADRNLDVAMVDSFNPSLWWAFRAGYIAGSDAAYRIINQKEKKNG